MADKKKSAAKKTEKVEQTTDDREPLPELVYDIDVMIRIKCAGGPEWFLKTLRKMKNVRLGNCSVSSGKACELD